MKSLAKIDRFYLLFGAILFVMAIVVIFTLRTIFSSLEIAGEVNEELFQASTPRINKSKLDQALGILDNKMGVPLDL